MHGQSAGLGKTVYSTQGTVSIYIHTIYSFFVTYIIIICTDISLSLPVEYIKNMLMKMRLESNDKSLLVSEINYKINYIFNLPVLEINNASQL